MYTHVASVETDDKVWLCSSVSHQHFRLIDGVVGGKSLLRADFVERDEHGGINRAGYVEERARDALHAWDAAFQGLVRLWHWDSIGLWHHT